MKKKNLAFNKSEYYKLVLILSIFYTVWKIIKHLNFIWLYKNNIPTFGEVQNPADYLDAIIIDWFVVILFMSVVAYAMGKWSGTNRITLIKLLPLHLLLSFLLNFFIFPLQFLSYRLQDKIHFKEGYFRVLLDRVIKYMDLNFLTYFSMLGIILLFYYFKSKRDEESIKLTLEAQLMEAKLSALNSQLQPHFIFNTLNSISTLIDENQEKAQNMIAHLGAMLRNTFDKKKSLVVNLEIELQNLNNYIQILKIRFDEDLEVNFIVEENIGKIKVPNMFLQPIVENSIKHGYGFHRKNLSIQICIAQKGNYLSSTVINNGTPLDLKGINKKGFSGNGLRILRERFQAQYGNDYLFALKNLDNDKGVVTQIDFPIL